MSRIFVAALALLLAGCTAAPAPTTSPAPAPTTSPASTGSSLAAILLTEADVPAGYNRFDTPSLPNDSSVSGCPSLSLKPSGGPAPGAEAKVTFAGPGTGNFISEIVRRSSAAEAMRALDDLAATPRDCATFTAETLGVKLTFTVTGVTVAPVGKRSAAIRMTAGAAGLGLVIDEILIAVWTGDLMLIVSVVATGSADQATAEAVTRKAWERAART